LKNNFRGGCYILEFFDEDKSSLEPLLSIANMEQFNKISVAIKEALPMDLSVARDRVGNIIFQFPITLLELQIKTTPDWDGFLLKFFWHPLLKKPPDCYVQTESALDRNLLGSSMIPYNQNAEQTVLTGNSDQEALVRIFRATPDLILYSFEGSFFRNVYVQMNFSNPEPRVFEYNGDVKRIDIQSAHPGDRPKRAEYATFINTNLYDKEKSDLEKSLAFKQYKRVDHHVALEDLRTLITRYGGNGAWLWDPFLRAGDILATLFFCKTEGVDLRAIGSTNAGTRLIYKNIATDPVDIIIAERAILNNPLHKNTGLHLEFRMQHGDFGWRFHDRFLIFPSEKQVKSRVYALGTSVNSFGKEHNILQLVSHPQPVADVFNELWNELNHPECIVWKFPV